MIKAFLVFAALWASSPAENLQAEPKEEASSAYTAPLLAQVNPEDTTQNSSGSHPPKDAPDTREEETPEEPKYAPFAIMAGAGIIFGLLFGRRKRKK
ncbi:MAG TPA: hypothetical protein DCE41_19205 [Cytophagales bacterium]|nr:hypothetical protein [Cytophagales bacterium]HAA20612.1 hypothetical protein [Cytophagales bacterium]HAP58065.1 hypothetical protein [Cytophagales bacterium]